MASPPRRRPTTETTPREFPEVTPPSYAEAVGATYLVESMMQMQKSLGELTASVGMLKDTMKDQTKTLNWIKYIIFIAIGALFVIGYFIDSRFDQIMKVLETK